MIQWREFNSYDWNGYCGCEMFPGGREPLITDLHVDGIPAVAIVDATGLMIEWVTGCLDCEEDCAVDGQLRSHIRLFEGIEAVRMMARLKSQMNSIEFRRAQHVYS